MVFFGDCRFSKPRSAVWRYQSLDGEFCREDAGEQSRVRRWNRSGGQTQRAALVAVRQQGAIERFEVIMPFPSGIVRSGSKVGSKYKPLASTNDGRTNIKRPIETSLRMENTPFMKSSLMAFGTGRDRCDVGWASSAADHRVARICGNYGGKPNTSFSLRDLKAELPLPSERFSGFAGRSKESAVGEQLSRYAAESLARVSGRRRQ